MWEGNFVIENTDMNVKSGIDIAEIKIHYYLLMQIS